MKAEPFTQTTNAITELLDMYEVNIHDPAVQQNILNCGVVIDNAYNGFPLEGDHNSITISKERV